MKFSIRDLLLVTLIVGLVLWWGLDHWQLSQRANRLYETAKRFAHQLEYKGFKIILHNNGDFYSETPLDD